MNFVDYTVFILVLLFVAFHSIFHAFIRKRQKTPLQYFLGNRSLRPMPVALSLFVSCTSAIVILGYPGEVYEYGMGFAAFFLSMFWVYPAAACLFAPVYRGLRITSTYKYMGLRFTSKSRVIFSILFFILSLSYIGVAMMGPAKAFEAVYGQEAWQYVFTVGIVCMFYTSLGGIVTLVWTDFVFFFVILATLLIVVIIGTIKAGGSAYVWEINDVADRLDVMHTPMDPSERVTFLNSFFGGGLNFLSLLVTQIMLQRVLSTRSTRETKTAVWLNLPLQCIVQPILYSLGAVLFAYYHGEDVYRIAEVVITPAESLVNPEPSSLSNTDKTTHATPASTIAPTPRQGPDYLSSDEVLIYFIRDNFSYMPGFQGLFFSAVLAGTMSLVSSALNAMAAICLEDYVRPFREWRRRGRETRHNDLVDYLLSQIFVIGFGFVAIGFAFAMGSMESMLESSNIILGVFGGPLLAAITMGMLCSKATQGGVLCGVFVGLGMGLWVAFGAQWYAGRLDEGLIIYSMSFMWYGVWTFCITLIVGIICSVIHRCCSTKQQELSAELDQQVLAICLRKSEDLVEVKVVVSEYEVDKLLEEAVEKSKHTIAEARKLKSSYMKSAPKLAKDEVIAYSKERKGRFETLEHECMAYEDVNAIEIEMKTRETLKHINQTYRQNRDRVLEYVLSIVSDIKPQLHENYTDKDD
ncbi:putative sodium-dependent multivitamin transporter [Glandiceps talaboti]